LNGTHPINRPLEKSTIKKVIGTEMQVLLCYPDFNMHRFFHLYTDTSDHQLGAVIMLDKNPMAFYSQILADALSRLDIDSLKIQEEEVLTLLSGSENNSISNIKLTIPIHNALIFKEQAKVKEPGLIVKALAQPHYSIHHIEGYDLLCYKENKQDLHSSIIETRNKEYCPGTMNIYFIRDRLELKRLSGIP
jgi:hypothetical protein